MQTPEFEFEEDLDNVRRAIEEMDVRYPVAVDNDYAVWQAFDNHYWPALYFVDAEGRIRHHHFGEGEYMASEMVLQMLLREAGRDVDETWFASSPTASRPRRTGRACARRRPTSGTAARSASPPPPGWRPTSAASTRRRPGWGATSGPVGRLADRPGSCAARRARRFHPRSGSTPATCIS